MDDSRRSVGVNLLIVVIPMLCALQLWAGTQHRTIAALALSSNMAVWGALFLLGKRQKASLLLMLAAASLGLVFAVTFAPATSKDFNAYAIYGRMIETYNLSPYTHTPLDIAFDPWVARGSVFWIDSPSLYGSLFSSVSALVMWLVGDSVAMTRFAFQCVAASALIVSALTIWRGSQSRFLALVFLLNPLVLTLGVNDAHADLLVGAFVVIACVLLAEKSADAESPNVVGARRVLFAGIAVGCAISIKIVAFAALATAMMWLIHDRYVNRGLRGIAIVRDAMVFACGASAALLGWAALCGGLDSFFAVFHATNRHSRFTVWNPMVDLLEGHFAANRAEGLVGIGALLLTAIITVLIVKKGFQHRSIAVVLVAGMLAYQIAGAYVLAWYVLWSLPTLYLGIALGTFSARKSAILVGTLGLLHASWIAVAYLDGYIASGIAGMIVMVVFINWKTSVVTNALKRASNNGVL